MGKEYNSINLKSVTGLSTQDILDMDVYSLDTQSLRKVVNRLVSSANKRIRRFNTANNDKLKKASQAYMQLPKDQLGNARQFSIKNIARSGLQQRNQLEEKMKQLKSFLQSGTSTIKGTEKMLEKVRTELNITRGEDLERENEFWDIYNRWVKTQKNIYQKVKSTNPLVNQAWDFFQKGYSERQIKWNLTHVLKKMNEDINARDKKDQLILEDEMMSNDQFKTKASF